MDTVRYEDFSRRLHLRLLTERIPITGTIEVTRRCPLACLHCYNNLTIADSAARCSELSYEEHCRVLDEIAEAGCLWQPARSHNGQGGDQGRRRWQTNDEDDRCKRIGSKQVLDDVQRESPEARLPYIRPQA